MFFPVAGQYRSTRVAGAGAPCEAPEGHEARISYTPSCPLGTQRRAPGLPVGPAPATLPRLAYPVMAEVYVNEILDREQFHRHCDTYKTKLAILAHLK